MVTRIDVICDAFGLSLSGQLLNLDRLMVNPSKRVSFLFTDFFVEQLGIVDNFVEMLQLVAR